MTDDPNPIPDPPVATPPVAPPPAPAARRHLAWIALGVAALGVAGGGAAAVALSGGSTPVAVTTAAADEETTTTEAGGEDAPAEGECEIRGEHRRPGAHGTVTGVDGATVTIEDDEGTATTVTTDDETTVLDVAEGALADLAEGDNVLVMTPPGEDGETGTARGIVDLGALDPEALHPGRPEDAPEPPADAPDGADGEHRRFGPTVGTVAAVDGTTVTVTTEDGDVTVTTDDETHVTVVTEIAVADLAEGDTIAARGESDDEGTVAADVIIRGDLEAGGPGLGLGGPGFGPGGPGRPGGPGFGPGGHERPGG